jgi:hypothetical protein
LHVLDDDQKQERIILAEETITILEKNAINGFQYILTVNKSWFFLEYFHSFCWTSNENETLEIPRQNSQIFNQMMNESNNMRFVRFD